MAALHAYTNLGLTSCTYRNRTETDNVTAHLRCTKVTLHRLLDGLSFSNLTNILGSNFSKVPHHHFAGYIEFERVSYITQCVVHILPVSADQQSMTFQLADRERGPVVSTVQCSYDNTENNGSTVDQSHLFVQTMFQMLKAP